MAPSQDDTSTFPSLLSQLLPSTSPSTATATTTPNLKHMLHGPPSGKSLHPSLTASISSLQLHPTLEATLHILNADLPSAHFLVRHMQAPPAVEGMLLHAVLHRCEGDFDNSRAWVGDVVDDGEGAKLVGRVYGGLGAGGEGGEKDDETGRSGKEVADGMIDDVERLREGNGLGEDEERVLERRVREEMSRLVEWCSSKFGTGRWEDASAAWVRPGEKIKQIGQDMTTGDKGHRDF